MGEPGPLHGRRVILAGRLASMPKREAARLLRAHGAAVVEKPDAPVDLVVLGEELPLGGPGDEGPLDESLRRAIDQGGLEVLTETQLWQRLGLVESEPDIHRLYTPAMLAELLKVRVAVIRRWHRRGLIVPAREVRRLPYFDFQEIATARRLAELLAAGVSAAAIEKKLADLARYAPTVSRPLAQLSVIVEGRQILLRQGDGLVEPGGQLRFDFEAPAAQGVFNLPGRDASAPSLASDAPPAAASADDLARIAAELEEQGQLEAAADMCRAALAAGGPRAELCFQLAELLYRLGDPTATRERYYAAIEINEDYVEARANLGCVLAELGQHELAIAAFQGALAYHGDYADAHYHLARILDAHDRQSEAESHWRWFLELAADSPWAEEARFRLGELPH